MNRLAFSKAETVWSRQFTLTPSSGTVPRNTNQMIVINGTITPTNFQNAAMGTYSDTIVVTVNP